MSPVVIGLIGVAALLILLCAGMWIGFAMMLVGFLGFAYLASFDAALGVLATVPYSTVSQYVIAVVPLFLLMGAIVSNTGIGADLYHTGYKWLGRMPGGLAMATICACAGFAAICGSSMATAATVGKVALPEMERFKYDPKLATGCTASGSTLGILIPPSLAFIAYGILTEQSIGALFMAGIIPGLLLSALFILTIFILTKRHPQIGPAGPKTTFREKVISLKYTWAIFLLFILVIGGIYVGIFTPSEAGAIGAFGAIIVTVVGRRFTLKGFSTALLEAGQICAMVMLLFIGAMIFMRFLAISKLPFELASFIEGLNFHPYVIFGVIVVFYIILGMFMDVMSAVVLTIPIIYPAAMSLGFDPIWFGVVTVIIIEMGLITPPVGMNVFVLSSVTDVPLRTIYRGVFPFVLAMIFCIILITIFPRLVLFLPGIME